MPRSRKARPGALHGVPLAHKDMYYDAGKVVTCGSKIRRDFVADDDLDGAAAPEGRRHGPARLAADGGVRLMGLRSQRDHGRCMILERSITSPAARRRAPARRSPRANLRGTGLGYRRLDPDARAFRGVTGFEDHRRPRQPRRRDAAVAVVDTVGSAGANRRRLRAAARLMAGADPEDPIRVDARRRRLHGRDQGPIKGLKIGVPTASDVDDLDAEVGAVLDETHRRPQESRAPRSSRSSCRTSA